MEATNNGSSPLVEAQFFFNVVIYFLDIVLNIVLKIIILMNQILNYTAVVKLRVPDQGDHGFLPEQAALFHPSTLKPH